MGGRTRPMLVLVLLCASAAAHARNERLHFPLADILQSPQARIKLNPGIFLYFGRQEYPGPAQRSGFFTANKKTNFFNKSDQEGCNWVFLSAAASLQERARQLGGNAVVNITSVYKDQEFVSETQYECGAGNVVGGVALRGEVVTIR